jgi:tetratricopeptide (TPR) repeat protein
MMETAAPRKVLLGQGASIDSSASGAGFWEGVKILSALFLSFAIMACALTPEVAWGHPQASRPSSTLPPARGGLLEIPRPDLSKLEGLVAEQIRSVGQTFQALVAQPNIANDDLAAAYGDLGGLYYVYEFSDAAEACYRNAALLAASDYRWHHLLGRLQESVGRLQEASDSYSAALELRPKSAATLVHLGSVSLQLNDTEQAAQAFAAALRVNPDEAAAHQGLGEMKLAEGKFAESAKHFERALEITPAANRIHYSLGMAYRGLGEMDKARSHLERRGIVGVRVNDSLVDELQLLLRGERVHLLRGRLAFSAGQFEQAARSFQEAVKADPESARARVNFGTTLGHLGDTARALEQFRAALDIDSQNVTAHFNLGTLYVRAGEHSQAVTHLLFVVGKQPKDLQAARELAKALLHLGRNDEALEYLPQVVSSTPSEEEPRLALAQLWVRRRQYRQARDLLSKAHESFPKHGRTAHALARLLASCPDPSLRDGDRAVEIANRVFRAAQTAPHAETLAMALAQKGDCTEAAAIQQKIVDNSQKSDSETLQRLQNSLVRYKAGGPCAPPP